MADQNKPPHEDLLIDDILAEARSLREGAPQQQGLDAQTEDSPQEKPAVPSEPAAQVLKEPAPAPEAAKKKKKRSLFGRRRHEIPEYDDEEDLYYGLQLKSLEEYRKDYEKTILIDSRAVREAAHNSQYSYLFSQSEEDAVDIEITQKFEELHQNRKKRVEQILGKAGAGSDDIFSLYEPGEPVPAPKQPQEKTPLPQEEPAVPAPEPPAVPSPIPSPVPSPVPAPSPAPKPEILPGPAQQVEIPQPISEPVYQPEPMRPVAPQPVGAPMTMEQREPAEPVKEPVAVPGVKEEVPPPQPRTEPGSPAPLRVRGSSGYRPVSGRPVHTIELSDFSSVFAAEAQEYPVPAPEPPAPVTLPKRPARTEFRPPIVFEHTSEFEAVEGNTATQAPDQEGKASPPPPIAFPAPVPAPEEPEEGPGPEQAKPVKKKRFNLFGTEEEENDDREELPPEPDELEDYSSPADAPSILNDLLADVRRLFLRLAVTGIAFILLLAVGLLGESSSSLPAAIRVTLDTQTYLILNLVFLLIAVAFSITPLWNGIRSLTRFQANGDTALSVAVIAAVVQSCTAFTAQSSVQSGGIHVYAVLAGAALFLNTAGKLSMARRICGNFRFAAAPEQKQAVQLFEDHNTALQMAKDCVLDTPVIAYQSKTGFLQQFLHFSYDADPSDRSARIMAPVGFLCSLAVCLVTLFLSKNVEQAITALTAATCVSVPFAGTLSVGLPLRRLSKIASHCGAMVIGYPAVEQFSSVNAVMVDAKDLFPRGTVILNGIKTFAGQRIDQAILDATALMCAVGGPLSDLFDQIIQSRREMLPKIDQPVYEDNKGVTGWVSGRRILVGSRALMEAHSIEPPSRDYEEKYIQGGKQVIYLASGGDLVAMFILSYTSDRRRSMELRRMEDNGISLIVRTCDPNITPSLLAGCFGLEEQSIRVLPEQLGSIYAGLTEPPREEAPALLATKGRPTAMMRLLTACVRQRSNISIAVALQNVSVILGLLLVGFLTFYSGLRQLGTSALLLYELFWAAAVILVPKLRKP